MRTLVVRHRSCEVGSVQPMREGGDVEGGAGETFKVALVKAVKAVKAGESGGGGAGESGAVVNAVKMLCW